MTLAIDFYGARPDPQAVKAAGYSAVLFYLRNPADAHAYLAAGLGVATIFEYQADESLQGASKGDADGRLAVQQLEAIGQPEGTLHTVNLADFAPTPGELAAIEDYWGAYLSHTSVWHVLPYGTGWLAEQMGGEDWENAMNDNGVLGSTVVPQAAIYQRTSPTRPQIAGTRPGDYDEDVILKPLPFWGFTQPDPPFPYLEVSDMPAFVTCNGTIYVVGNDLSVAAVPTGADGTALQRAFGIQEPNNPLPSITAAQLESLKNKS